MPESLFALTASGLYAYISWQAQRAQPVSPTHARLILPAALGLQAASLLLWLFPGTGMQFSFSLALSIIFWMAVTTLWFESRRIAIEPILPYVLPLAALACALPLLFAKTHDLPHSQNPGFVIHFMASMMAYGLFALAALQALFMHFAERHLHRRELSSLPVKMPPLLTLETLLFRLIGIAFVLLTVAVGSGVFFSETIFGKPASFDHKTLFSMIAWSTFGILLAGRHFRGWRGKIALRWTLSGFGLLLLGYIGSRFVIEIVLGK